MPIKLAIPKETDRGERRVALDPSVASRFAKMGLEVMIQKGAGAEAQFPDEAYADARVVNDAKALLGEADIVVKVAPPSKEEVEMMKDGAMIAGFFHAHKNPEVVKAMQEKKISSFAMELIPRISRAQSMDALSSQAAVGGYKAAIMGADLSCRFFPMLTTAAGTIRPAKVVVIGAGVAGLQAIATARRLGAMVEAYDVRSATKEQVESLGAKFLDLGVKAEGEGGYARELTDEEKDKQQEALAKFISQADVLITTAAIPGKPSPMLIPQKMVNGMKSGAVIIDLAAEGGGNCELTKPGKTINKGGVTIHGPLNVASQVPLHASEMYAKNLLNFLTPMLPEGKLELDWEDEIIAKSCLTHEGEIKHEATRSLVEGGQS
ncbi:MULTISPECIES: Re/Si-specific NAD(P)(+) transhydrogenase subunit alpha [unclassified Ectothiorhodospira]|uniref:Re/Si-specific NAD(P)(+) transhydrogenase subunit alpha n=1 Tax=unclassified Ectothiorhodospira TaxID=2684909 RepID=UPI001EE82209|nr:MULTISPECIES: Re/Si-specific NAD(P)(+) transhydrogenase subunit alpha [unclassified Ectothiorhodospira]MCG5515335.1 Re/Si-specific NAD(P)(+) transhydrogenase subunit alpha [Ectothiorhodospira sp. 9100]MCG5519384.1 Re/Si-specific NAD(P)(+) transhydrogenase subunit alpha [Ectothiorhodospira sp. 9905]